MSMRQHKNQPGFLLLQLMVVIAVLCSLAMIAIVYIPGMNTVSMRLALNHLYTLSVHARYHALATGQMQTITLDSTTNSYTYQESVYQLPQQVQYAILKHIKGPPSNPSSVLREPITFAGKQITFYADGSMSSGTIYLLDNKNNLYALTSSVSATPCLHMYKYDKKWHSIIAG